MFKVDLCRSFDSSNLIHFRNLVEFRISITAPRHKTKEIVKEIRAITRRIFPRLARGRYILESVSLRELHPQRLSGYKKHSNYDTDRNNCNDSTENAFNSFLHGFGYSSVLSIILCRQEMARFQTSRKLFVFSSRVRDRLKKSLVVKFFNRSAGLCEIVGVLTWNCFGACMSLRLSTE